MKTKLSLSNLFGINKTFGSNVSTGIILLIFFTLCSRQSSIRRMSGFPLPINRDRQPAPRLYGIVILCLLIFALCSEPFALSQIPQGFNYQAIARDAAGNPVTTTIEVMLTVKPDSSGTGIIWEEIHAPVTPNSQGLFSLVLGK